MKVDERDSLLRAHAEASERLALTLGRILGVLERPERDAARARVDALFPPPFRLLEGDRGLRTLIEAIPGFAGLWTRSVPNEYVAVASRRTDRRLMNVVACECGPVPLEPFVPTECVGGCRRWFLLLGDGGVRVWRAPEDSGP